MTPMEILNKIVETEDKARSVYDEAISIREGFDKYIQEHFDVIRKEHFDHAEVAIAAFEESEKKLTDEAVAKLNEKLTTDLNDSKNRFESAKDDAVQKIFKLAVDFNA